ncbi:delta-aminolevulinic acid dehydratase [Kitasatospora xanthocidica]|uniref:hypothetical protein n=1 Tax=Kitasatospora xanthocidica TaxID=83382 RepID=UPI001678247C|nr:hypothetical protein [Kitasatospora xanthocidica]GHF91037.1 delta-aminolevulinic acid dehydratase [Kitasatospora xanthocidica]
MTTTQYAAAHSTTARLHGRPAVRSFLEGPELTAADLSMVLLVREDREDADRPMPTVTVTEIPQTVRDLTAVGIRSVKVFANSLHRDQQAGGAIAPDSLMVRAIHAAKDTEPGMAVMTENCLCGHTDTGECHLPVNGRIDLGATAALTAAQAVIQARAGADIVGPAAMTRGTTWTVRQALDEAGHRDVATMPHLIFDSALYEGYRTTMRAAPASGARRPFQISPRSPESAVDTGLAFLGEGADMLLLEPGMLSVDILTALKRRTSAPLMPFSVSGEYTRLAPLDPATGKRDLRPLAELFTMLKRAGAERIITYAALDLARLCA